MPAELCALRRPLPYTRTDRNANGKSLKRALITSHNDERLMKGLGVKLQASRIHEEKCYGLWVNAESLLDEGNDFLKAISSLVDESGGLNV